MNNVSLMDFSELVERMTRFWEAGDFEQVFNVLGFIRMAARILKNEEFVDYETLFECGMCPSCGSDETRVIRTHKPIRGMYCDNCGKDWDTVTINLMDPDALQVAADIQKKIDIAGSLPYPARLKNSLRVQSSYKK
nr:hypothetical protein [uncultured Desulfobacter sp.]